MIRNYRKREKHSPSRRIHFETEEGRPLCAGFHGHAPLLTERRERVTCGRCRELLKEDRNV